MFTKMKFCYCRHGYEVLKVINATDVCFLAKIPQNVRSDLFVCSLMDLMNLTFWNCICARFLPSETKPQTYITSCDSPRLMRKLNYEYFGGTSESFRKFLAHFVISNSEIWLVSDQSHGFFGLKKSSESSPTDVNKMAGYWLVISHRHDGTVMVLPLTCRLAAKWVQYSPH